MPDLTPEMQAELRRLLTDSTIASPGPWRRIGERVDDCDRFEVGTFICEQDAHLIVSAVNALPALLDAAAERDALAAKVERVRALHHEGAPFVRPGGQDRRCSCGGRWPCPTIRALDESEANK